MFSFFIKKSEVIVDCFTHYQSALEYTPVDYGIMFYPEWWKKTENSYLNERGNIRSTIKNCIGFIDYYKNSLVIPSWFEMELSVYEQGNEKWWTYEGSNQFVNTDDTHNRKSFEGFALENGNNIKFTSPWGLKTKENIQWVWSQPTWSLRAHLSSFTILPAVVDFKYQHSTNVNLFVINEDKFKKTTIAPNTPLVSLHPLTEKKIILKRHLVSYQEFLQIVDGPASMFLRRNHYDFSRLYKRKKDFLIKQNKCPFQKNERNG